MGKEWSRVIRGLKRWKVWVSRVSRGWRLDR